MAGLSGVLFAHFMGTVSIGTFFLNQTFLIVAMLVIGGMQSLAGTVLGVSVITLVIDVFRRAEAGLDLGPLSFALPPGSQELILAAIMLLILMFRKGGIMGGRELSWPWPARGNDAGECHVSIEDDAEAEAGPIDRRSAARA